MCAHFNGLVQDSGGRFIPRKNKVKIYDTFLILNEIELFKIRVNELSEFVDYFVVAESNETFTGKEKPRHFWERREEFEPFLSKIRYIDCSFPPELSMNSASDKYNR